MKASNHQIFKSLNFPIIKFLNHQIKISSHQINESSNHIYHMLSYLSYAIISTVCVSELTVFEFPLVDMGSGNARSLRGYHNVAIVVERGREVGLLNIP